jgi:hypothetical protein
MTKKKGDTRKKTARVRDLAVREGSDVKGGSLAQSVSAALDGIFKAASTAAQKVG